MMRVLSLLVVAVIVIGGVAFGQVVDERTGDTLYEPLSPWDPFWSSMFNPGSGQDMNMQPWLVGLIHSIASRLIDGYAATQLGVCGVQGGESCQTAAYAIAAGLGLRLYSAFDALGIAGKRYDFFIGLIEDKYGPDPFNRATP